MLLHLGVKHAPALSPSDECTGNDIATAYSLQADDTHIRQYAGIPHGCCPAGWAPCQEQLREVAHCSFYAFAAGAGVGNVRSLDF